LSVGNTLNSMKRVPVSAPYFEMRPKRPISEYGALTRTVFIQRYYQVFGFYVLNVSIDRSSCLATSLLIGITFSLSLKAVVLLITEQVFDFLIKISQNQTRNFVLNVLILLLCQY